MRKSKGSDSVNEVVYFEHLSRKCKLKLQLFYEKWIFVEVISTDVEAYYAKPTYNLKHRQVDD